MEIWMVGGWVGGVVEEEKVSLSAHLLLGQVSLVLEVWRYIGLSSVDFQVLNVITESSEPGLAVLTVGSCYIMFLIDIHYEFFVVFKTKSTLMAGFPDVSHM